MLWIQQMGKYEQNILQQFPKPTKFTRKGFPDKKKQKTNQKRKITSKTCP